jgi:hypothetical protein
LPTACLAQRVFRFVDNGHRHSIGAAVPNAVNNPGTWVVGNACRGVDLHPGDVARAVDAMRAAAVRIIRSDQLDKR